MGMFSRLFQGADKQVEAELEELYSKACASYSGQSISEARSGPAPEVGPSSRRFFWPRELGAQRC